MPRGIMRRIPDLPKLSAAPRLHRMAGSITRRTLGTPEEGESS
ncbi:MAG: hypothetical protein ACI4OS_05945 [Akkermansia sp.]